MSPELRQQAQTNRPAGDDLARIAAGGRSGLLSYRSSIACDFLEKPCREDDLPDKMRETEDPGSAQTLRELAGGYECDAMTRFLEEACCR
jgi:hypothetical protein